MTERERLIELLRKPIHIMRGYDSVGEIRMSILDAQKRADTLLSNGVIVPPCKVGDKVWFLNTYYSIAMRRNFVYEAKVVRVYIEKGNVLTLSIQVKNEMGTTEFPRITEIGKTVFLTKEEAERALKEREKQK